MRIEKKYSGVVVPMVTPLTADLRIDEASVALLFEKFAAEQIHPFIFGTTGEASLCSSTLRTSYLDIAAKHKRKGTKLYAGIAANSLAETISNAKQCKQFGVDVVVATIPNYYTLTDKEVQNYFEAIADASPLPLVVYNIPATTHCSLSLDVLFALIKHPNIVGVKDSERNEERLQKSIDFFKEEKDCSFFVGWAAQSANGLQQGADGIIPSTGNLVQPIYKKLYDAVLQNDNTTAEAMQKISDELGAVYQSNKTLGQSLWALKYLMQEENICKEYVLPPLSAMDDEVKKELIENYKKIFQNEIV